MTTNTPLTLDCRDAFRLRRDAIYMKTESGILFRSSASTFALKGGNVYGVFQRLLPHLDGKITIDSLLSGIPENSREPLGRLLGKLRDTGIIERVDPDDVGVLDSAAARCFAPQIEFIAHYDARPNTRFLEFRESDFLLCGSGVAFRSAGLALLRNGLRRLRVCCADGEDLAPLVEAAGHWQSRGIESRVERVNMESDSDRDSPSAMTLYCAENPDLATLRRLNQESAERGSVFLPAHIHHGLSLIGPMVLPAKPGCWHCTMLRWADNAPAFAAGDTWKRLALGQAASEEGAASDIPAQILGNSAALEAFKYFVLRPQAESQARLLVQEVATLGSELKSVLAHPDCPVCRLPWSPQPAAKGRHDAVQQEGALDDTALLEAWKPYLDAGFGVFRGFDDAGLEQLPLRLTRLSLSRGASERRGVAEGSVTGWSLRDGDGARANALREAVARSVVESPARHLAAASLPMSGTSQGPCLSPATLWGWQGSRGELPASHRYLPVRSAEGAGRAWVPIGAVHARLDRDACFDPHGAGVGCGVTTLDALEAAMLSLCEQLALCGLAEGSLAPRILPAWRGCLGKDVEYLAVAAAQLGRPEIRIGLLTPRPGLFAAVECAVDHGLVRTDELPIGTGFSPAEAVADLLGAEVARAQLQRHGLTPGPTRRAGRTAGAEIELACAPGPDLTVVAAADGASRSLTARRGSTWWWLDVTPPDVALTRTLRVVKLLWDCGRDGGALHTSAARERASDHSPRTWHA